MRRHTPCSIPSWSSRFPHILNLQEHALQREQQAACGWRTIRLHRNACCCHVGRNEAHPLRALNSQIVFSEPEEWCQVVCRVLAGERTASTSWPSIPRCRRSNNPCTLELAGRSTSATRPEGPFTLCDRIGYFRTVSCRLTYFKPERLLSLPTTRSALGAS